MFGSELDEVLKIVFDEFQYTFNIPVDFATAVSTGALNSVRSTLADLYSDEDVSYERDDARSEGFDDGYDEGTQSAYEGAYDDGYQQGVIDGREANPSNN